MPRTLGEGETPNRRERQFHDAVACDRTRPPPLADCNFPLCVRIPSVSSARSPHRATLDACGNLGSRSDSSRTPHRDTRQNRRRCSRLDKKVMDTDSVKISRILLQDVVNRSNLNSQACEETIGNPVGYSPVTRPCD